MNVEISKSTKPEKKYQAVIDNKNKTVVSTDMLVENIHFNLMYVPLKHLGYKSVVVNLSDIFAMNAKPEQITVSLSVSNRFTLEAIDELYSGIKIACEKYKVDLIGGDTTSSEKGLIISVTAIGSSEKNFPNKSAIPNSMFMIVGLT